MNRGLLFAFVMAVSAAAFPQFVWRETTGDLGVIREADGKAAYRFTGYNAGADSVAIARVRSSCGCTTADYPVQPVAPGDSVAVTVVYNPAMRPGEIDKTVTVLTGKGDSRLRLTGKVIPSDGTVERMFPEIAGNLRLARRIVPVGNVRQGHRRMASVACYNAGKDTLSLRFGKLPDCLEAVAEPAVAAPGDVVQISVVYEAGKKTDAGHHALRLPLFSGRNELCELEVRARVMAEKPAAGVYENAPKIAVDIRKVVFPPVGRSEKKCAEVIVRNDGGGVLRISGVSPLDDALSVKKYPKAVKPGKTGKIILEADGARVRSGVLDTPVAIFSNDPANMTVRIRAVGEIIDDK